jgi:hypothetical protein
MHPGIEKISFLLIQLTFKKRDLEYSKSFRFGLGFIM